MILQISIHDFSVIIEALDRWAEVALDTEQDNEVIVRLIRKLDEQGLSQVMGE